MRLTSMNCESYSGVQHSTEEVVSDASLDGYVIDQEVEYYSPSPSQEKLQLSEKSSPNPSSSSETQILSPATPSSSSVIIPQSCQTSPPIALPVIPELCPPDISGSPSNCLDSSSSSIAVTTCNSSSIPTNSSTFCPIFPAPITTPATSSITPGTLAGAPSAASQVSTVSLPSSDLKFLSSNGTPKTISMLSTPSSVGTNGMGSKIVQVSGAGGAASITYVGTLIKKGKAPMPHKVFLTSVRSQDGNITKLILPKTQTAEAPPLAGSRFILPKSRGGMTSPQTPRSFIVQSGGGRGVAAAPVRPLPPPSAPVRHLTDTLPQAKPFPSSDLAVATISPATDVDSAKKVTCGPGRIINGGIKSDPAGFQFGSQPKFVPANPRPRTREPSQETSISTPLSGSQDNMVTVDLEEPENTSPNEVVVESTPENTSQSNSQSGVQISNTLHIPDQPVSGPQYLLPLLQMPNDPKAATPPKPPLPNPQPKSKKSQVLSQHVVQLPSGQQAIVQIISSNNPGQQIMSGQAPNTAPCPTSPSGSVSVGQATAMLGQSQNSQPPKVSSPQEASPPSEPNSESAPALPSEASETPPESSSTTPGSLQPSITMPVPSQQPEMQSEPIMDPLPVQSEAPPPQCPPSNVPAVNPTTPSINSVLILQNKQNSVKKHSNFASIGGKVEDKRRRKHLPVARDGKKTITVKRLEPLPEAGNVDPLQIIQWDPSSSIGTMPGSQIKFCINSYGVLQVYDVNGAVDSRIPIPGEVNEEKDEICRCVQCQCYGLVAEFVDKKYCSTLCRDEFVTTKAFVRKRELILDNSGNHLLTPTKRKLLEKALGQSKRVRSPVPTPSYPHEEVILPEKIEHAAKAPSEEETAQPISPPKTPPLLEECRPSPAPSPSPPAASSPTQQLPPDADLPPSPPPQLADNDKVEDDGVFTWHPYLEKTNSSAAWVRLFNDPYPSNANLFLPGQLLEAFDPSNQAEVCVASVAEVNGYRLRIHFDGYLSKSDMWVNANSPDIMPCGWAQSMNLTLSPPPGWDAKTFTWDKYLASVTTGPAPKQAFTSPIQNGVMLFEEGMKLEAVDKKNRCLVCVATVAGIAGSRIRVHFDSWDDHYDYWCDSSSPLIRPVGWCKANRIALTAPNKWGRPFSWQRYLSVTGSRAAPAAAFTPRPPVMWRRGTKLEAVDPHAPAFVSVATIAQVLPYQVRVNFDGMPAHYGWWYDDDSPDLHPIGWCQRTGTQLAPPPTAATVAAALCPTGACNGRGNFTDRSQPSHVVAADCPYTPNRVESVALPTKNKIPAPRIPLEVDTSSVSHVTPAQTPPPEDVPEPEIATEPCNEPVPIEEPPPSPPKEKSKSPSPVPSPMLPKEETEEVMDVDEIESSSQELESSGPESQPKPDTVPNVMAWDTARVTRLVETAVGSVTDEWTYHSIDGEAFLMLAEIDLIRTLNFSSSDASLIMNLVTSCQNKFISV